jgi:hypothetical protein
MSLRWPSILAFVLMVVGWVWMVERREVLARSLPAMIVQGGAVALMIAGADHIR